MTLFLDTETTGLDASSRIVEIALIDESGNVLLNTLCNPEISIPYQASSIHGIYDEMVKDAPLSKDVVIQALELMRGHDIVIYNADYDTKYFPNIHTVAKSISCCMLEYAAFKGDWNDYFGNYRWHKLVDAARQTGYKQKGFHRALADAMACGHVWNFLKSNQKRKVEDGKEF